jgi:hypothetical protein
MFALRIREAALHAPPQLLPILIVPALELTSDSAKAIEESSLSAEKTPTQAIFHSLSSARTFRSIQHTHQGRISINYYFSALTCHYYKSQKLI